MSTSSKNLAAMFGDLLLSVGRSVLVCHTHIQLSSFRLEKPDCCRFSSQVMCCRHRSPCWFGFLKLINHFFIQESPTLGAVFQIWSDEGTAKDNHLSLCFPGLCSCHSPEHCSSPKECCCHLYLACCPQNPQSSQQSSSPAKSVPYMCWYREVGSSQVQNFAFVFVEFYEISMHSLSWERCKKF